MAREGQLGAVAGALKITHRVSLSPTGGLKGEEQGRAAAPKNGWAAGKCKGPCTASPLLAVRIGGVYPDHPGKSERMQTRVAPCLRLQKEPFPPRWMGNADRPVKPQMCAISVVFLLRASASLSCEREPSFDSGKHINACLNSSSFSKSIRLHLMDFSET